MELDLKKGNIRGTFIAHDFIFKCIEIINPEVHITIMQKLNDFLKYMILYANEDFRYVIKSAFNLAQEEDILKQYFSRISNIFTYNTIIIYSDTIIENICK